MYIDIKRVFILSTDYSVSTEHQTASTNKLVFKDLTIQVYNKN